LQHPKIYTVTTRGNYYNIIVEKKYLHLSTNTPPLLPWPSLSMKQGRWESWMLRMSHEVGASSSPSRRLLLSTVDSVLTPSAPSHTGNVDGLARIAIYSCHPASGPLSLLQSNDMVETMACAMSEEDVIPLFDFFSQWG
jgi:hypothetical protein